MGAFIWAVDYALSHAVGTGTSAYLVRVIVGIVGGVAVFIGLSRLVRLSELAEITDMLRAVLRRGKEQEKTQ